jgi:hypothetical protein
VQPLGRTGVSHLKGIKWWGMAGPSDTLLDPHDPYALGNGAKVALTMMMCGDVSSRELPLKKDGFSADSPGLSLPPPPPPPHSRRKSIRFAIQNSKLSYM